MLAAVRASNSQFAIRLTGGRWRWRYAGSVVILGSSSREKAGHKSFPSRYTLPEEYASLLERLRAGSVTPDTTDDTAGTTEGEDETEKQLRIRFRKGVKAVSRHRIKQTEPDLSPAELRVAKFHEGLWVEELEMLLELQHLQTSVEEIFSLGGMLYQLDITEVFDQFPHSLERFLQKASKIQITSRDGDACLAFVQPGSSSGKLLVSTPQLQIGRGPYDIAFLPNRFPSTAMHQALDSQRVRALLKEKDGEGAKDSKEAETNLPPSLNAVQRRALLMALESPSRLPMIIWGPPGTGKSTVAAFLVWCLVQKSPRFQILVTAPSNIGADVLCSKLAKLGLDGRRMLRLNAIGRNVRTVPADIKSYGRVVQAEGRSVFQIPSLEELRSFRVVVTTCICAFHITKLIGREGASGWFSHVIVDEAGEATEPETLVPMSVASPDALLCLLGDHFQLGPLVLSNWAARFSKLEASMIERLVNERFHAAKGTEGLSKDTLALCEEKGVFFLTESFRSHPDIMEIYSKAGRCLLCQLYNMCIIKC